MPHPLDAPAPSGPSIPPQATTTTTTNDDMLLAQDEAPPAQAASRPPIRLLAQHAIHRRPTHDRGSPARRDERLPAQQQRGTHHRGTRGESVTGTTPPRPFYTSAQWTADGTSLIASSSAQSISSFVLPTDLLQPAAAPRTLLPHATFRLPEPTQAVAPAPYFSLADPASQHLLVGCRDHPLQLYHAFPSTLDNDNSSLHNNNDDDDDHSSSSSSNIHNAPLCSYKLIRKESEQYITPASLLWSPPGTHFICGSANRIDYFDISRPGSSGPLLTIPTIPSRRHISKGHGVGMKGTVAALALSPGPHDPGAQASHSSSGILAAGTWSRWMGLYDLHRTDRVVANWSVANATSSTSSTSSRSSSDPPVNSNGQGIVQTAWSPCGRYLLINERLAQGLLIYDIRVSGQLLAVLAPRLSTSQQRLHCDIFAPASSSPGNHGFEVWAGCQDGRVAVWEGAGTHQDVQQPAWGWAAHDSPVGSVAVHPCGSVVASCSGGWAHMPPEEIAWARGHAVVSPDALSAARVFDESSIKVWSLG